MMIYANVDRRSTAAHCFQTNVLVPLNNAQTHFSLEQHFIDDIRYET